MSYYQNGPIPPSQYPYSPFSVAPEEGIYRITDPTVVSGSSLDPPFGRYTCDDRLFGGQPSPFRQAAPPSQQGTLHPHALLGNPYPTAGLEIVPCARELSAGHESLQPIYFTTGGCVGINMDDFMRGELKLDLPDEQVFGTVGESRKGGRIGIRWPGYPSEDIRFQTHNACDPVTREQLARSLCKMSKKFFNNRKNYKIQRGCEKWEVFPSETPYNGRLCFQDVTLVALRYFGSKNLWIPEYWVRVL